MARMDRLRKSRYILTVLTEPFSLLGVRVIWWPFRQGCLIRSVNRQAQASMSKEDQ